MADSNDSDDLFSKIKVFFGEQIKEQVKMINSNTDLKIAEIKNSLEEIKNDISTNSKSIADVNLHVDDIKKELTTMKERIKNNTINSNYESAVNKAVLEVDKKILLLRSKADNTLVEILNETKKIVGVSPVPNEDLNYLLSKGVSKDNVLKATANDFLTEELKFPKDELSDLNIVHVSRPKKDECDRIYIYVPFIPPQLYSRFVSLSKNTFDARQKNDKLKTHIRLGDDDLKLLVKEKGDKDWENEPDLTSLGPINDPEWHKIWPVSSIPDLTSPPKGCQYHHKNVQNISNDSSEEMDSKKFKSDNNSQSDPVGKAGSDGKSVKKDNQKKSSSGKTCPSSSLQPSSQQDNSAFHKLASIFNTNNKINK